MFLRTEMCITYFLMYLHIRGIFIFVNEGSDARLPVFQITVLNTITAYHLLCFSIQLSKGDWTVVLLVFAH